MEDLILFLIVMAISLIGAISRKKKKRPFGDKIVNHPTTEKNDDVFSWLEKISGIDEETRDPYQSQEDVARPVAEVVEKEVVKPDYPFQKYEKYAGGMSTTEHNDFKNREVHQSMREPENKTKDEISKNPISDSEIGKKRKKTGFSLEKALVYSEILNRKYC